MTICTAGNADRDMVAAMLARAFQDDPATSWILPDHADRARRLPRLFRLLFDGDAGGMRLITPGGEAATLWRGPGQADISLWEMVRNAPALLHALGMAGARRALLVSGAIAAHHPPGDYWYLHIAGCDPAMQGKGLGGLAVRAGLQRGAGRLPAYLETATERNLGFYRAIGFEIVDEWNVPNGGPRFWSMLRPAG
ncbi:GNAT family N-acetyltransferase [Sphingomonas sp. TX0543]|uniref:GNAT family N-acetyltransferase n=1 Tax=unclassified Sphingomonas TaxID=196159 RepID=UPI0010F70999|nr:GNAT family N-acetyltransferase [Sphingomonas sp. 3P27F8]